MAEVWDIARYVEDHPDDLEQRWRLAKKLYMAWEYRIALEHLQVLKNEGHNRLNVQRYLAATYYRLGRYDDAIRELEDALGTWPDEMGLREQLARVLETAGSRERAAEVWADIKGMDPQHPIAGSAVRRLNKRNDETPVRDLRIGDSDSGIDLRPGRVCPNCGAQNSEEFDRCWQCHAALGAASPREASPQISRPAPVQPIIPEETLLTGMGVLSVLVVAVGLFLSLRLLYAVPTAGILISSVWDVYQYQMTGLRVGIGVAALFAWPAALWAALYAVRPAQLVSPALVNFSALFLAGITYIATWMPRDLLFFVPILPVLLSLAIVLGAFGLSPLKALGVWALHLGITVALLYGSAALIERYRLGAFYNPVREIMAVRAYEARQASALVNGAFPFPDGETPYKARVMWNSTGSAWLDGAAGEVEFNVLNEKKVPGLKFEIQDAKGSTLVYDDIEGEHHVRRFTIHSGQPYNLIVGGPNKVEVKIVAGGLLTPSLVP